MLGSTVPTIALIAGAAGFWAISAGPLLIDAISAVAAGIVEALP